MKRISAVLLLSLFVVVNTAFAQTSRNIPVSLTLTGDQVAQFEVYPDATSTTPLTSLTLISGGHTINDNVKYIAGEVYLDIQPGNTGSWYLLIYTANDVSDDYYYPGVFTIDQGNLLLANDGSTASLHWKYNNPLRLEPEVNAVGTELGLYNWIGDNPNYIFMVNNDPTNPTPDIHDYINAQIMTYKSNQYNTYFDFDQRARITFGVDLTSSCRAATYEANLVFEVYYE